MSVNRRRLLGGAGFAGAAAATGVIIDRLVSDNHADRDSVATSDAARFGNPRIPSETVGSHSHLFHLGAQPAATYDGGSVQQADQDNFPILAGQDASVVLLTLEPGGIREPHWHPSAWEINIVRAGVASWAVVDGNGNRERFEQRPGSVVFAPQGSFHYFENRGPTNLEIVIIQNTSSPESRDNIGIGESISKLPSRVLSAIFGVPAETFDSFKKFDKSIVVLRKR